MKRLTLVSAFAALCAGATAQQLGADYVTWPSSTDLATYVTRWNNNGTAIADWEDENFFVSRVKPKAHIRNVNTQIYSEITDENDKRLMWWVPIGNANLKGVHTDALPNGVMDSEVFSMWSYVTHYGDWISPYGWVPASLADVAHKNGVAVSGVASIPYGSINTGWSNALSSMINLSAENVGKFLYYHGVDGLGYNSEFSGWGESNITRLCTLHNGLVDWMKTRNPIFENMWYAGTVNSGQISFDIGLNSRNDKLFQGASYFLNYNWNNRTTMANSISYAESMGRDPLCLYAGFNMQGGEPGSNNWVWLKNYRYSIGLWGAHEVNMLWQARNGNGSATEAMQRTYLKSCEQWFGNGARNPAIRQAVKNYSSFAPHDNFHGMSAMMSARSALSWDLATEPFYTYFNLGNGAFFNWQGDRVMDGEWYNIGIQDYLPTWRFWFAPSFLDKDVNADEVSLNANFTWDDAYFGGSCLNIKGSTANEYLHLFKTEFRVSKGDVITLRYKLLDGQANIGLAFSRVGIESTAIERSDLKFLTLEQSDEVRKQSHAKGHDGWVTVQKTLTSSDAVALGKIAVVALHFTDAENMNLLLGEFSITKGQETVTPDMPVIDKTKLFINSFSGVDGKIIFHMPGEKAKPEPTYNLDVNTAMYRLWAQEENGAPQFLGATTSWAGLCFRVNSTDDALKVRLGVSAVSTDMKSESEIAWGEWMTKPSYVCDNTFAIDKTVIKPGQPFTIAYKDPRHEPSKWTIYSTSGEKVAEMTGVSCTFEDGLTELGGYDLVVDEGTTSSQRLLQYIQISGVEVGAYPEITALTVNSEEAESPVEISLADELTLGYTGTPADGSASRGLALNEKMVGAYNNQVGIQGGKSFSVCVWMRLDEIPTATWDVFNIVNRGGSWPMNNWGWCWARGGADGKFGLTFRNKNISTNSQEMQYTIPGARLQPKVWTHLAFIFEYAAQGFRAQLYINGIKQESTWIAHTNGNSGGGRGTGTTDDYCSSQNLAISSSDMILFGGVAYQGAGANGQVDDFQIWTKALSADEVKQAMFGFPDGNVPADLVGLWSFEDEPDAAGNFFSKGSKPTIPAYHFSYEASANASEGQGGRKIEQPVFVSGCPFLAGTAFPVRTTPTWSADNYLTQIDGTGTDTEGSATVKFGEAGDHNIRLTLENSWGKDSREYPVFTVKDDADAIRLGNAAADKVYTIGDMLFVEFADRGNYSVTVCNAQGASLSEKSAVVQPGAMMRIRLAAQGVYVVRVAKDGKTVRTLKLARQ